MNLIPRHRLPQLGLAGYWTARNDVAASGTWLDRSGCGHDATLNADAYVSGGGGLIVDGTGDYAACGNVTEINSATGVSLGAWVIKSAANKDFAMGCYASTTNAMGMQWYTDGNFYIIPYNGGSTWGYKAVTWSLDWFFLVAVFDGALAAADRRKLYANGDLLTGLTLNGTAPTSLSSTVGNSFEIGRIAGTLYSTCVAIDQAFVYSRALDASEIKLMWDRTSKMGRP